MNRAKLLERIVFSEKPWQEMKKIRLEKGIKQNEMAKRLGVTQSTLADYEGGRRKNPGVGFVKRFVGNL